MIPRWKFSAEAIRTYHSEIRARLPVHQTWIADCSPGTAMSEDQDPTFSEVAFRNVQTAQSVLTQWSASRHRPNRVLLRYPIVVDPETANLIQLVQTVTVTVVLDHFRHAELASRAAVSAGRTIDVLLDADCGHVGTGVNPGPDSVLLAEGIRRLPGLRIRGIYLRTRVIPNGPRRESDLVNAIAVGRHCQKFVRQTGIPCEELISDEFFPGDETQFLTAVIHSPGPSIPATFHLATPGLSAPARVISRPSLEACVISAGRSDLNCVDVPVVLSPTGATIRTMDEEQTTLTLSGESLDLKIGDEVITDRRIPAAEDPDEAPRP